MQKILFIDRDGTINTEAPPSYQIDNVEKIAFYPDAIIYLNKIAKELDYILVLVTNQDGLGTAAYPLAAFTPIHRLIMDTLKSQGIHFTAEHIDVTYPQEQANTRKPNTGMLTSYLNNPTYDIPNSLVIGDRITDMQLAHNLNCKGIWINDDEQLGATEITNDVHALQHTIVLKTTQWQRIYEYLKLTSRTITHNRNTTETNINITLNLDGTGVGTAHTGVAFLDHMLQQLIKHSMINMTLTTTGDIHIDEHHTIEDTAIALGEAFGIALGNKLGIQRYGFTLPMDDCLAQVAIDFGGRPWLVWDATFTREKIGDMPTEMCFHFFKSFTDAAKCNLNVKAEGTNEHHKIEAIFKAFAKAIHAAIKRDANNLILPTTKGLL